MTDGFFPSTAVSPFIAFVVTFILIRWLTGSTAPRVLDHANDRSLHTGAVRRSGGLGMMLGIAVSWISLPVDLPAAIPLGVALLALVSLADDVSGLPVPIRLLAHGAAAAGFSLLLLETHGWAMALLVALAMVWMINLYNFMDGSDGLAGGMALIGFACYGLIAWQAGDAFFAAANFCIAAAAAAFLVFNFHPARIFMGDAGAIPLGFLAGSLGATGWLTAVWPAWLPVLVFSPFIADASVTLAKRCLKGEKFWQAHRAHYYQRLVQSGLGHRNTALLGYALMLGASLSALWALRQDSAVQAGVGALWIILYLGMMLASERRRPGCRTGD